MLSKSDIKKAADDLYNAEINRQQIDPLTLTHSDLTMDEAYAIQKTWVERKIQQGQTIIGYKIGLTSRAMQKRMQINEPDYGVLLNEMVFVDGTDIQAAQFLDPMVEVELAFVLKTPLKGENVTLFDVLNATDYVVPALEIISARSYRVHPDSGYTRKIVDTIADNAANSGIIMGGSPVKPHDVDLRWVGALLYVNGVIEETGLAAGVLNHPANGICWVARRFAPHGIGLEPGQVILSGSFTSPVSVKPGSTIHADFGSLGAISCHFV